MTGLPSLRVRVVVKGLTKLGFKKVRQKGSHVIFHPGGSVTLKPIF